MNSCSETYCFSANSQNARLNDIFQLTTLILITRIVFLDWILRILCRNAVHHKLSWLPVLFHCMSLILSVTLKLWQTQQFSALSTRGGVREQLWELTSYPGTTLVPSPHRSLWPNSSLQPGAPADRTRPFASSPLLWGALCFQRVGQRRPSTALWPRRFTVTLCNTMENHGLFPLHFHCMITDRAAPKGEWLVLQSWANNLRWQIKFHQISGSMTVLGIIRMHAGRDDISDSFKINRGKGRSPTVRRKQ